MRKLIVMAVMFWASVAQADTFSELIMMTFGQGIEAGAECERVASGSDTDEQAQVDFDACKEAFLDQMAEILRVAAQACAKEAQ